MKDEITKSINRDPKIGILKEIVDYNNIILFELDLNSAKKLKFTNSNFESTTGFSDKDFDTIDNLLNKLIHPDDHKIITPIISEPVSSDFEIRWITKDNRIIWLEHHVRVTDDEILYGWAREITQKEEAEKLLVKNEKQFSLLFKNMEQGFALHEMIYDENGKGINYRFILINEAFEKLIGVKRDKLIGKTVLDVLPKIESTWIETFSKVATNGKSLHFKNYSQEFNKHYDIVAYSPQKGFFATIFTDISKSMQYQKELLEAKERAEQGDLLKTEFLQNLSHEIRTPMNGIVGFSKLLATKTLNKDKVKSYTDIINNSAIQLMRIIDDVLEISTLETKQVRLNIEDISINTLLTELYSIFKIDAEQSNLEFKLNLFDESSNNKCYIKSDKTKLSKIINNLLSNAFKYTEQGYIELGYFYDEEAINIYVKDSGIGIDPENFSLIFHRFSQENKILSNKVGGLGLGLSIAKENTELLGGRIWVESQKGSGSTFMIYLPLKAFDSTN